MSALPEITSEPVHPENWPPHPPKKMVMTPMMATVGFWLFEFIQITSKRGPSGRRTPHPGGTRKYRRMHGRPPAGYGGGRLR